MQIDEIQDSLIQEAVELIKIKFLEYDDFIFGLLLATIIWMFYHRFIAFRQIKKGYQIRINDKDELNKTLKNLVYERLDNIEPSRLANNTLWKKIKNSFKID